MPHVSTPQSRCRFAIATADVTPPVGTYHRMWGAATHDVSAGVHRPLRATVSVFAPLRAGDGSAADQIVQVALDHCLLGKPEMEAVLGEICSATGLSSPEILIVFSHTHAAGMMAFDRQTLPGGEHIPDYLRDVARRVADLYKTAAGRLQPANFVYGIGRCDLATHRDFWDAASQQFVCGFNPDRPVDDTVQVARVTSDEGTWLASFVNYACHPTTLAWDNQLISPDFPGAMREVVERETGAPCVFLQGASAEIGPKEGFVGDVTVADRNGRQLGFAALSTLIAMSPAGTRFEYAGPVVSGATIGTWRHVPLTAVEESRREAWQVKRWYEPLAYRDSLPALDEVRTESSRWQASETAAMAAGDAAKARDCRAMVERQTRLMGRLSALPPGARYPLEVVLVRMGDAVWLTVPGEHYSYFQTEIRRRFPHTPIMVMTLGNGWGPSYLPTADVYGKGIYQESIALLAPGCLERLVESVAVNVDQLLRDEA